jgi:NDP-sugar pyrophosphorylase family protein
MLPVIILAGGLGTRLGELSKTTPKALIPVADVPFIFHQLRLLKKNSFEKVIICAGYLGEQIKSAVGDGQKFGLHIDYFFDWPKLLGTGGALRQAARALNSPFMVTYGDSYLDIDYQEVERAFLNSPKPALMTVYKNDDQFDRSNIIFSDNTIVLYDKKNLVPDMKYIDYGLSCLNHAIINDGSRSEVFDLADLLNDLSKKNLLAGFQVFNRFYEIGSPQGLKELDSLFRTKNNS